MEIREVCLEEWHQNRLWICSSENKMGSSVLQGDSMSKCTGANASWWKLPVHCGIFKRGNREI